ncbi:NACHT domain-containing protein [Xanthomonas arboricola]|uniref:NACHT domain-containing protein n=1 Tax=Xanthomonas arboricola TaxID=56448 RepID=UPI0004BAAEF0|nr:NACHT domain-containing protein [Xanthomonas arboricola]
MEETSTINALRPVLSQFRPKNSHNQVDIRESIALVDFHVRLIYTLYASFSKRPEGTPIRISATPGFGTMLSRVREYGSHKEPGSSWIPHLVCAWSKETTIAIDRFKAPRYSSFKSLRDRLSHGQPLPSDPAIISSINQELLKLLEKLEEILGRHLSDTTVALRDDRLILHKPKEKSTFEISPLWSWSSVHDAIQIYSHLSSDGLHYIAPDGDIFSENSDLKITKFKKAYLGDGAASQASLGRLLKDVLADIGAYTEDYSKPSYFFGDDVDIGVLFIPWTRSTSEDNVPRIDAFRIGLDDRREWRRKPNEWVTYAEFLKHISNWEVLARRMAIGLDVFSQERAEEEKSRLGFPKRTAVRGPTLIKEKKETGLASDHKEFDLVARIDDSCRIVKPSTSVFFLIGQAGLGKTELMVSAAMRRAKEIEADPKSILPLYLFISSSGRTLSSLEDAVNSALTITKLLSSHSAKALCRNGLLVLLVDGFDELLGSSGYENALGSLEPWFNELKGKGVLVASARSSYYLTQYRKSLAQATHLNVDHTLVELQPWSKTESKRYLQSMGATEATLRSVKEREWPVLSVPFFAKAFAAWLERQSTSEAFLPSVYEIVIEQYLEREAMKLKDPNAGELLSANELRELFSDIAETMQASTSREIEQSDLAACAEAVVGTSSLDQARPGLSRRLSSLCGLGVAYDTSGQSQFSFSHEVLFDCFLSLALQRKLSGVVSVPSLLRLLGTSKVNPVAFEWLIEKMPTAITILANSVNFSVERGQEGTVISSNLGALWEAMLSARSGVPPTPTALGLQLDNPNFAESGWSVLDLSRSNISSLAVPAESPLTLKINETTIEFLSARTEDQARKVLKGVESAKILSLHIGERFADNNSEIRDFFEDLGLIKKSAQPDDDGFRESVSYFIDRLTRKSETPVVFDRGDYSAEDYRLSWIAHANQSDWRRFLDILQRSEMARLEPISASGSAKVRLAFNKPLASLLEPEISTEASAFWAMIP